MMAAWQELWEKQVRTMEEMTGEWWDVVLRRPSVLESLGSGLGTLGDVKTRWDRALEQTWQSWRLPSALDVERVYERLGDLEEQVEALRRQLEARGDGTGTGEAPRA